MAESHLCNNTSLICSEAACSIDPEDDQQRLENTRRALINILDDLRMDNEWLEKSRKARLNILDDLREERLNLEDTRKALLNILDDFDTANHLLEEKSDELRKSRDDLERIVKERTSDLQEANLELTNEVGERIRAEKSLRDSELRYRTVADKTYDFEFWINPEGKYLYASPSCLRVYGYPRDVFFADPGLRRRVVHPDDIKAFDQHVVDEANQIQCEIEYRILRPDGVCRWIGHNGQSVFDENGRYLGVRGSDRDITERKKADELKDEFIGMVSHEIKTPLTIIMGCLYTMKGKGLSEDEENVLLDEAVDGTDVLAGIVENLLELSRSRANRLQLRKETTEVGRIAREVARKYQSKTAIHQLSVEMPGVLPAVLVDPIRLERILFNLVENAVKYSLKGGDIKISARKERDHLIVCVSDHGPGISPENQKKVFESFEQLGITNRRAMQGVGLGLKVCRTLVEAHGGRIWVESRLGEGSSFFFTLPIPL